MYLAWLDVMFRRRRLFISSDVGTQHAYEVLFRRRHAPVPSGVNIRNRHGAYAHMGELLSVLQIAKTRVFAMGPDR